MAWVSSVDEALPVPSALPVVMLAVPSEVLLAVPLLVAVMNVPTTVDVVGVAAVVRGDRACWSSVDVVAGDVADGEVDAAVADADAGVDHDGGLGVDHAAEAGDVAVLALAERGCALRLPRPLASPVAIEAVPSEVLRGGAVVGGGEDRRR